MYYWFVSRSVYFSSSAVAASYPCGRQPSFFGQPSRNNRIRKHVVQQQAALVKQAFPNNEESSSVCVSPWSSARAFALLNQTKLDRAGSSSTRNYCESVKAKLASLTSPITRAQQCPQKQKKENGDWWQTYHYYPRRERWQLWLQVSGQQNGRQNGRKDQPPAVNQQLAGNCKSCARKEAKSGRLKLWLVRWQSTIMYAGSEEWDANRHRYLADHFYAAVPSHRIMEICKHSM